MHHHKGCEHCPQDGWQQFLVTPPVFSSWKARSGPNEQSEENPWINFWVIFYFLCFVWCYRTSPSFHGNFAWCRSTNHLYVWDLPPFEWTFPKLPALHSLLLLPPFPISSPLFIPLPSCFYTSLFLFSLIFLISFPSLCFPLLKSLCPSLRKRCEIKLISRRL